MMGGGGGGGGGGMPDMPDSFYTIAAEGPNSFGRQSWSGPTRGPDEKQLKFKAYALTEKLDIPVGASRSDVLAAMKGKVIDKSTLVGTVDAGTAKATPTTNKKKKKKKKKKSKKSKKSKGKE